MARKSFKMNGTRQQSREDISENSLLRKDARRSATCFIQSDQIPSVVLLYLVNSYRVLNLDSTFWVILSIASH